MEAAGLRHIEGGAAASPESLLSQVQVMVERDGGLIDAYVPLSLIRTEDIPVDHERAVELEASFRKEAASRRSQSGQKSPIELGEIIGEPEFLVIDGFHRTTNAITRNDEEIYATIRTASTLEEIIDARILAANHRSLRFARLGLWIGDAWSCTEWAEKLEPLEVFTALHNKSSFVKLAEREGLAGAEGQHIETWAQDKVAKWALGTGSIVRNLTLSKITDPEITMGVREHKGRHLQLQALTAQHIQAISPAFPGNFEMQRLIKGIALDNNLSAQQTRKVVAQLGICETPDEAAIILEDPKFLASIKQVPAAQPKAAIKHTAPKQRMGEVSTTNMGTEARSRAFNELVGAFVVSEIQVALLSLENLVFRGRYIPDRLSIVEVKNEQLLDITDSPVSVNPAWEEDRVDAAIARMESFEEPAIKKAAVNGIAAPDARTIFNRAAMRVVADTKSGALRHITADDKRIVPSVLNLALLDETNQWRLAQRNPSVKVPKAPANTTETTVAGAPLRISLEDYLPRKETDERRLFILQGLFGLSPFIAAQVIGESESHAESRFRFMLDDLRAQTA